MLKTYLEFEKPIKEFDEKIVELKTSDNPSLSNAEDIAKLENKREETITKIFGKLNRWQRVQLARHPERPFTLDYINAWSSDFVELHGDRHFADDPSVVTGLGTINGKSVMYIGQQKGRNTKENLYRNFGMMRPEGYRKALRMMKLAEKFNKPVITLVDTQGAYPGLGAEERGQGEAIARNLFEMAKLRVPIISIVIGEGASGGALGIGLADRMLMLENTWYSVISPEGCASILWRDAGKASEAAEALRLIPNDLVEVGICDRIVPEPHGGAHRNPQSTFDLLKSVVTEELDAFEGKNADEFLASRIHKYDKLGAFTEA